jgi:hypothetical protein
MRRVYLDVCALGRPLDDQAQMRIRVEADFVSCDDRLIRQCRRVQARIWVGNPVEYCVKENLR